jgi:hypothetical protein
MAGQGGPEEAAGVRIRIRSSVAVSADRLGRIAKRHSRKGYRFSGIKKSGSHF